ncbi:MAG: FAD/NAD(P)-binding oxidoreductase [Alphaproteobacteria bacterium]|nr:FAD/NAD(P)-binding oxidoreductase [Alphaproteobacteria bacterium]
MSQVTKHHRVLIAGGGAAGITVAARLKRKGPADLDIAIVEPSDAHYYQPAFTLVGAGAYTLDATRKAEAKLIPPGVKYIRGQVKEFDPANNRVKLAGGTTITYDYLVVATGVKLDWSKIEGLRETLGRNGVCSNYSPDYVNYTWECVRNLNTGAKTVFTQAPLPFKCPGAPQKAAYLTADHMNRNGLRESCDVQFFTHAPVIFGVPFFARELVKVAARHKIGVNYQHNLVAVDGAGKTATFERVSDAARGERVTVPFDLLHVSPAQSPHDEVRSSALANAAGWVEVDQATMQHVKFPNVFSLGDVCSTPNSKTAAAVRKQAPVVVRNLLHMMAKETAEKGYDGYASCPLTTAYGKVIMAEFTYGGKVTPTLPLDPAKESAINWQIKTTGLPILYWNYMLKGHEWFPKHNTAFVEPK